MKRNYLAFLMAAVMMLTCIFMIAPAVHAETPADTSPEVTPEAPTDAPTDEPSEEPSAKPSLITQVLTKIIRFFKWLIPQVKPYLL